MTHLSCIYCNVLVDRVTKEADDPEDNVYCFHDILSPTAPDWVYFDYLAGFA